MSVRVVISGIFRFVHITSACFVIGNSVSDVIWTGRDESGYKIAYIVFGICLLISGVVNIVLLKPSETIETKAKQAWSYLLYGKAAVWVLFIPIPDLIAEATGHSFPRSEFNCALALVALVLSILCKTVRDAKTIKQS